MYVFEITVKALPQTRTQLAAASGSASLVHVSIVRKPKVSAADGRLLVARATVGVSAGAIDEDARRVPCVQAASRARAMRILLGTKLVSVLRKHNTFNVIWQGHRFQP